MADSTSVLAPFSAAQVASLNAFQLAGVFHPFTCPNHDDHRGHLLLVASTDGWRCAMQECDYTQGWAHAFMTDRSWERMDWRRTLGLGDVEPVEPVAVDPVAALDRAEGLVAQLAGWDMLTLAADGSGVATSDAPWARERLSELAAQLELVRSTLG